MNYVLSKKNFSQKGLLYTYRFKLAEMIFKKNLDIHIYGNSVKGLKRKFPFKPNLKTAFSWENIHKIYKNYKFSIVIENSRHPEYFTEKIMIPLLCGCIPIYFGCLNIDNYFKNYVIQLSGNVNKDIVLIRNIFNNPDKYYKKINIKEIQNIIHLKNLINKEFLS